LPSAGARVDAGAASAPGRPEVSIEICEGSIKQFATGDDDEVDRRVRSWIEPPEHLSNQSFSTISSNSITELPGGDDAQTRPDRRTWGKQEREVAGGDPVTRIEDPLELFTPSHALKPGEPLRRHRARLAYELETVSRLRPLARRRLSTSRPFLVAIRVRKPCVFLRWRRLGWKVRFMISDPCTAKTLRRKPKYYRSLAHGVNEGLLRRCVLGAGKTVCYSPSSCEVRRVSPRSFPQLWKKLWKSPI
jgi:hypothetical protein